MSSVTRRLIPLYVSAFFAGLVFWYAVEKVLMVELGFTTTGIILVQTVMIVCSLAFEIPSGVLADRWSRKGVLMLSHAALGFSALFGYLSHSPTMFVACTILWGIYYALNSGASEAIVYDTLLEENGSRAGFEKHYGRTRIIVSVSLVIGALIGGFVSNLSDPRTAFLISIPSAIFGLIALSFLREPTLHRKEVASSFTSHIKETIGIILNKKIILYICASTIMFYTVYRFLFEFYQVWLVTLGLGLVYFGLVLAVLNSSFGIAGVVAHKLKSRNISILLLGVLVFLSCIGLFIHSLIIVIVSISICIILLAIIDILLTGKLQDELTSHQRSSVTSAISTAGIIALVITSLLASVLSRESIFWTTPLLLLLLLGGLVPTLKLQKLSPSKPGHLEPVTLPEVRNK